MVKKVLSLSAILALSAFAEDAKSLTEMFANGKVKGEVRSFYINRNWDKNFENINSKIDREAISLGGHLNYNSARYNGFSVGATGHTTNGLGLNSSDSIEIDPTLFGKDKKSYSLLAEAYVEYKNMNTSLKVGRQKLATPLAGADDVRMIPNHFEAIVLANNYFKDTTLIVAHVDKMAEGTFANAYGGEGSRGNLGLQGGYGLGAQVGKFVDMENAALGMDAPKTNGVTAAAMIYTGIPNLKLQLWDYYAHDILNAIYAQGDYKINFNKSTNLTLSGQYIREDDVGDKIAGEVDADLLGAKATLSIDKTKLYVAYTSTGTNLNSNQNGGIILPWGGYPLFVQGMVTRHGSFADTDSWRIGAIQDMSKFGIDGLSAHASYMEFDVGENNSYINGRSWLASESFFDLIYKVPAVENLKLRLRGNYPDSFATDDRGWDEYRFIAYYGF